jgi:hypothetical protein
MRGNGRRTEKLFSYTSTEWLVPMDHPQRPVRDHVAALDRLSRDFARLYAQTG